MPPFDIMEFVKQFTVQVGLGPLQFGVIGLTILVVKKLKDAPNIPTPKKYRPYIAFGVGLVLNVILEFCLGTLAVKPLLAEQLAIWFVTLGIHGLFQSQQVPEKPKEYDPRDGRFGDPRRP